MRNILSTPLIPLDKNDIEENTESKIIYSIIINLLKYYPIQNIILTIRSYYCRRNKN